MWLDRLQLTARRGARLLRAGVIALLLLLLALLAADVLVDRPLRRYIERRMNEELRGYSVVIGGVDFSPWNFSLQVEDLSLVQQAHPEPPVGLVPRLLFSVQWLALLQARLVADVELWQPTLFVHRQQLNEELSDEVDLDERGWQDALQSLYPLKINELAVHDGTLTYIDDDPERPLELSRVALLASNIRNVRYPERTYPSELELTSRVFDTGTLELHGRANLLEEPYAGIQVAVRIADAPLERLQPVVEELRLRVSGGLLTAHGEVEYAPTRKQVRLEEVTIAGLRADYLNDPQLTERALAAAREGRSGVETAVTVDRLALVDAELGVVSPTSKPAYRLYVSDLDLEVAGYHNRPQGPPAVLEGGGRFMGEGASSLSGTFRPDEQGPAFDLRLAIETTPLTALNGVVRAHTGLDVAGGSFALYSEVSVADGRVRGYVKPLFGDVDVYDPVQDREDSFWRKLYERLAGAVAGLLENEKRDEVVTVADLVGPLDAPDVSNAQVVVNLLRNAFVRAILPGFLEEADRPPRRRAQAPGEPGGDPATR